MDDNYADAVEAAAVSANVFRRGHATNRHAIGRMCAGVRARCVARPAICCHQRLPTNLGDQSADQGAARTPAIGNRELASRGSSDIQIEGLR